MLVAGISTARKSRSSARSAAKASASPEPWPFIRSSTWRNHRTSVRSAAAASINVRISKPIYSRIPTLSRTTAGYAARFSGEIATCGVTRWRTIWAAPRMRMTHLARHAICFSTKTDFLLHQCSIFCMIITRFVNFMGGLVWSSPRNKNRLINQTCWGPHTWCW